MGIHVWWCCEQELNERIKLCNLKSQKNEMNWKTMWILMDKFIIEKKNLCDPWDIHVKLNAKLYRILFVISNKTKNCRVYRKYGRRPKSKNELISIFYYEHMLCWKIKDYILTINNIIYINTKRRYYHQIQMSKVNKKRAKWNFTW